MALEFSSNNDDLSRIKVIGIGGAGNNVLNTMIDNNLQDVKFLAVNTDLQDLRSCETDNRLQIGEDLVHGLGAGGDPEIGKKSAEADYEKIKNSLKNTDVVILTGGMGGGTGTGAVPVFAKAAKEKDILSVAIVTYPFNFEGTVRKQNANKGIEELKKYTNALIVIQNDRIKQYYKDINAFEAFKKADFVQYNAAKTLTDIISKEGYMNVDLSDVKTVMAEMGYALIGLGEGTGEDRAEKAVNAAIAHPLMYSVNLENSKAVLVNVSVGYDLNLSEFGKIMNVIHKKADKNANIISGLRLEKDLKDVIYVSVVATGIPQQDVSEEPIEHTIEEKTREKEQEEIKAILNRINSTEKLSQENSNSGD
ncbi:MAG: cell division protein FtsZ [Candidatus Cloacimonetes bacterium]|nr:cell division protein FtsZ [Candidatus Cloacimonadota bacterium]MBS3766641.1 cell division protein FtsZ [Candidatus Cloacimonadota bacterium]